MQGDDCKSWLKLRTFNELMWVSLCEKDMEAMDSPSIFYSWMAWKIIKNFSFTYKFKLHFLFVWFTFVKFKLSMYCTFIFMCRLLNKWSFCYTNVCQMSKNNNDSHPFNMKGELFLALHCQSQMHPSKKNTKSCNQRWTKVWYPYILSSCEVHYKAYLT